MNGWTMERKQRQAELIRQWQPWQHSTGARTVEGKAKVSRNAFKGGLRAMLKDAARYLREQKQFVSNI